LKIEVYRQPGALSFVVSAGSGVSGNPLLKKDSSFLFEQSIYESKQLNRQMDFEGHDKEVTSHIKED